MIHENFNVGIKIFNGILTDLRRLFDEFYEFSQIKKLFCDTFFVCFLTNFTLLTQRKRHFFFLYSILNKVDIKWVFFNSIVWMQSWRTIFNRWRQQTEMWWNKSEHEIRPVSDDILRFLRFFCRSFFSNEFCSGKNKIKLEKNRKKRKNFNENKRKVEKKIAKKKSLRILCPPPLSLVKLNSTGMQAPIWHLLYPKKERKKKRWMKKKTHIRWQRYWTFCTNKIDFIFGCTFFFLFKNWLRR